MNADTEKRYIIQIEGRQPPLYIYFSYASNRWGTTDVEQDAMRFAEVGTADFIHQYRHDFNSFEKIDINENIPLTISRAKRI